MLTQKMSGCYENSVRPGPYPYGSHQPAVQQVWKPPTTHDMERAMPMYSHVMQPSEASLNGSAPLTNGLLPGPTLLTSQRPIPDDADKQSRVDESLLDDEKSGAEDKAPTNDCTYCGVDFKPILPVALAVSTVIGGVCMLLVEIPWLSRFTTLSQPGLLIPILTLYVVVLGLMAYCTYADPGQMKKTRNLNMGAVDLEEGLPRRAHESFQYSRPIRRYDHYCKWLHNVIGLLNHREFVVMVGGLVMIAVLGIVVDLWLAVLIAEKGCLTSEIIVALHLAYSLILFYIGAPILKIHMGLISRNELAQEWKHKEHYVANSTTMGDNVPVEELEDDEYNEFFDRDAFVYDRSRNPFDHGCFTNCCIFWCQPRWPADADGDF